MRASTPNANRLGTGAARRLVRSLLRSITLPVLLTLCAVPHPARAADPITEIEKPVGRALVSAYRSGIGVVEDPLLQDWVDRIGGDVARASGSRYLRFHFVILNTDVVNAYTLPGGYVMVTRGLLETTGSDDELAGVLAHEAAHVARRHTRKQLAEAALVGGAIALAHPRSKAAKLGAAVAAPLVSLAFSRHQESEADRYGVVYAARAGYDPRGLLDFIGRFGERDKVPEWVETHPSSAHRERDLKRQPDLAPTNTDILLATAKSYEARGMLRMALDRYRAAFTANHTLAEARTAIDRLSALPQPQPIAHPPGPSDLVPEADQKAVDTAAAHTRSRARSADRAAILANGFQTLSLVRVGRGGIGTIGFSMATYGETELLNDVIAGLNRTAARGPSLLNRWAGVADYAGDAAGPDSPQVAAQLATAEVKQSEVRTAEAAGILGLGDVVLNADWLALQGGILKPDAAWWARYGGVAAMSLYAGNRIAASRNRLGEAEHVMGMARLRLAVQRLDASERVGPVNAERARDICRRWFERIGTKAWTTAAPDAYPESGAPTPSTSPLGTSLGRWCLARAAAVSAPQALAKTAAARRTDRPVVDQLVDNGADPEALATALGHLLTILEDERLAV